MNDLLILPKKFSIRKDGSRYDIQFLRCKFQFSRKCLGSGILVLDKGEKAEEGPVSQLVANEEGYFRKLLKAAGKDVEDSFLELLVEEAQEEEHYDKRE